MVIWSVGANGYCPWYPFQQPNGSQQLIRDTEYGIKNGGCNENRWQNEKTEEPGYWLNRNPPGGPFAKGSAD